MTSDVNYLNDTTPNVMDVISDSGNLTLKIDSTGEGSLIRNASNYDPIKHYDEQAHANVKWMFDYILPAMLGFLYN